MRNLSRNTLLALGAAGVAVVAFLAFGVFGVHTLFIDKTVDEANPFEAAPTSVVQTEPDEAMVDDEAALSDEAADAAEVVEVADVVSLAVGSFADGAHPTSGEGLVLSDGTATVLRFENFTTDNGPDLNVYLRSSANPDDYIDLGDLKGNIGDQNYELPADFDAELYDLVDIWCVRFSVSFGSAQLVG